MSAASTTSHFIVKRLRGRAWKIIEAVLLLITLWLAIYNWIVAEDVADTLSTHYIGAFPAFIPQLRELVQQSKKTLLIACDVPGYGVFSAYDDHVAYKAAIASRVGQVNELKMIVLDEAGRKRLTDDQFRGADVGALKLSRPFGRFSEWSGYTGKDVPDMASFESILLQVHRQILRQDFIGKNVPSFELSSDATMPIFVWIGDEKVAIFSIPSSRTPPSQENAFVTRDPKLIKQLVRIFRSYQGKSMAAR